MTHRVNRRSFIVAAGASMAAAAAAGNVAAQPPGPGLRNVLLYVVDDQGRGDAGCYGNPVIKTPGLDRLAATGMLFTHGFCTTASCSPSRSVILSGLHNHANGMYGLEHSCHHFTSLSNVESLPVRLSKAGYRTARMGKYHVGPEAVYHFDTNIKAPNIAPADMADACRDFIAEESGKPFFLYFCTVQPHRPFPREGADPVAPEEVVVPPFLPDTPECREELAQYYGSVQTADAGLLRLLDILEDTGRSKDTLVIYVSDNGIAFPGAKTTLYEPGINIPCVVRDPFAGTTGISTDAMITWADIAPTILDFAGVDAGEKQMHGRSFLPVLRGEPASGWDEIYASHTFHEVTMYYPMRAVRERRYKLIWNIAHGLAYPFASDLYQSATWQAVLRRGDAYYGKRKVSAYVHRPAFELYDLETDPDEVNNLAGDPAHAETLERLKRKLRAFQERTDDPWILKWERE
ncbi:MAG TPA: sulfatase [Candidatus Hydrogenedentes bacterium]|jgi:N-sulfoglucosamine sulfohydrolase|nr:sulfatase [Candidatus Hydrogenedentota bacterium]HPJ98714.1 sulfatase [Candidatus Hydrogenedentota bacterium]